MGAFEESTGKMKNWLHSYLLLVQTGEPPTEENGFERLVPICAEDEKREDYIAKIDAAVSKAKFKVGVCCNEELIEIADICVNMIVGYYVNPMSERVKEAEQQAAAAKKELAAYIERDKNKIKIPTGAEKLRYN